MKTEEALQTAKELISGPRAKTYGDKVVNHGNIAKLWSAYIDKEITCLLYTSPSPRDGLLSRMPSSA